MYCIHEVLELETKDCGIPGAPHRKGIVWGCKAWYPYYRTIQKALFFVKNLFSRSFEACPAITLMCNTRKPLLAEPSKKLGSFPVSPSHRLAVLLLHSTQGDSRASPRYFVLPEPGWNMKIPQSPSHMRSPRHISESPDCSLNYRSTLLLHKQGILLE